VLVGEEKALLALLGATLFVLSDSALAINRFVRPFKAVHAVVLSTYYAAQWLIALSV
jgi:alkenylglycerophosphocholine/alkenylglycerophosphoethanolamine hydrolase